MNINDNEASVVETTKNQDTDIIKKSKLFRDAMDENQGDGESAEFVKSINKEIAITNNEQYKKDIEEDNSNNNTEKKVSTINSNKQDTKSIDAINDFLYKEYEGHCQICGDTFAYKNKNISVSTAMNRGTGSDIKRDGNTISLCHKHHQIFIKKLQKDIYWEEIKDEKLIDIALIDRKYEKYDWVDKDDKKDIRDSFYRLNDNDDFIRDEIYFLPIKIFGRDEYIKFTTAHMYKFLDVINNN